MGGGECMYVCVLGGGGAEERGEWGGWHSIYIGNLQRQ